MSDMETDGARRRLSDEEIMDAVPRGTGGREARLGVFVIFGLLSFVVALYWLTDPALFRGRYLLVTTVENAGGVRVADPVQMSGINVGRVNDFRMTRLGQVDITLEIEGEWDVPTDSRTRLGAAGIFGGRTIEIVPGTATTYFARGDTIPSSPTATADLLDTAGELSAEAGTVIEKLQRLLNEETVGSVQGSARELETLLTQLSDFTRTQRGQIQELVTTLQRSAEGLEAATEAGPDVARVVARADSAVSVLTRTGSTLDEALVSLRSVLDRMERGEGTLGRLAQDEALYENINAAVVTLNELMLDVRENPGRYVRVSIF